MANEKRLIDANALINDIQNNLWHYASVDGITSTTVLRQTITDIRNQPTVDAVEVVRCKDCQFFDKRGYEEDNRQQAIPELDFGWCSVLYRTEQACNFCSSGERKENG